MCWGAGAGRVISVCYLHYIAADWNLEKPFFCPQEGRDMPPTPAFFFDNCVVLSYRLLQVPSANGKDGADQSDVELSESLSELYQRKFSETSAATGPGHNKKRRMYSLELHVHVVNKR